MYRLLTDLWGTGDETIVRLDGLSNFRIVNTGSNPPASPAKHPYLRVGQNARFDEQSVGRGVFPEGGLYSYDKCNRGIAPYPLYLYDQSTGKEARFADGINFANPVRGRANRT
jgi:hypothetical protein